MHNYTIPNVYDSDYDKYLEWYEKKLIDVIEAYRDTEEDKTFDDIAYSLQNVDKSTRERTESINHLNEEIYPDNENETIYTNQA